MTRAYLKTLLAFSVVVSSAALAGGALAEDELFTRIPLDTVFSKTPDPPPQTRTETEKAVRVLNITQLGELLKEAGMEPEVGETAISVKVEQAKRTFTTVLGLDEGRQQLIVQMRLIDLEGKTPLAAERLLALLTVNRDLRPAMFSYSEKNKRLELLSSIENDQISGRRLREEIKRLAGIADNMAPLWETDAAQAPAATAPSQTAVAGKQPAQSPPLNQTAQAQQRPAAAPPAAGGTVATAASAIIGRWSAARSAKEAFAMQLNADSSFVLVYVKDGKQSKSTGKFTLSGSQLTLSTDDGGKFGGSVTNVSTKSFEFTPPTGASGKLTFQKAS